MVINSGCFLLLLAPDPLQVLDGREGFGDTRDLICDSLLALPAFKTNIFACSR
jgi:hypothetical protein